MIGAADISNTGIFSRVKNVNPASIPSSVATDYTVRIGPFMPAIVSFNLHVGSI